MRLTYSIYLIHLIYFRRAFGNGNGKWEQGAGIWDSNESR